MSVKIKGGYCPHCEEKVMAQGTKPNHVLHLVLSIVTFGAWLLIWPIVAAAKVGGYCCTKCGTPIE